MNAARALAGGLGPEVAIAAGADSSRSTARVFWLSKLTWHIPLAGGLLSLPHGAANRTSNFSSRPLGRLTSEMRTAESPRFCAAKISALSSAEKGSRCPFGAM